MIKRFSIFQGIALLAAVLLLSACGVNLSGEPEIKNSQEIISIPTTAPTATSEPVDDATTAATTADAADTTDSAAPETTDTSLLTGGDYDLGFEVYVRECATCHGAADGVGPSLKVMHDDVAARIEGMGGAEYIYQSIVDPGAYLVDGYANMMPATYAESLTDDEMRGLITFVLEFDPARMGMTGSTTDSDTTTGDQEAASETPTESDTSSGQASAVATSEGAVGPAIETEDTLTVTGNLIAGTTDGEAIPADLPVTLYAVDPHGNLAGMYEGVSAADATYTLENVARTAGMMYFIEVNYDGVPQGTSIAGIEGTENSVSADIVLYERTTNPDTVAITWAEVLVNYAPIDQAGIEVWLNLELANTGDRIVTTDELSEPNNWYVSVVVELPVAAFGIQPMQTENSQRYNVEVIDGVPVVKDTWPLRPGQAHTLTIAYYLPYDADAVIEHGFNYTVMDGMILLPNDTVDFSSDQFDTAGVWRGRIGDDGVSVVALEDDEKIDPDKDFTLIKAHDLEQPITSDQRMVFELSGRPTRTLDLIATTTTLNNDSDSSNNNILALALAVLGVGIILLAGVLWWRQRQLIASGTAPAGSQRAESASAWKMPGPKASKDDLLAALAALDQAYEDDEIDEITYEDRRAQLSERLLPLLNEDE